MTGPHADATNVLDAWRPTDPGQEKLRQAFNTLLQARSDACLRSCEPGHITASAVVFNAAADHVLLTLHPRVGSWLQLGGHCEPTDATLRAAALREAHEESGVDGLVLDPEPVHVDLHPITCSLGRATRHFDVRFVLRAPIGAEPQCSSESRDLRWWPVTAPPPDSDVEPLIAAATERIAAHGQ